MSWFPLAVSFLCVPIVTKPQYRLYWAQAFIPAQHKHTWFYKYIIYMVCYCRARTKACTPCSLPEPVLETLVLLCFLFRFYDYAAKASIFNFQFTPLSFPSEIARVFFVVLLCLQLISHVLHHPALGTWSFWAPASRCSVPIRPAAELPNQCTSTRRKHRKYSPTTLQLYSSMWQT